MSLHSAYYTNETSNQLGYSSWENDEKERSAHAVTLGKAPRFASIKELIKNGNVAPLVLASEKSAATVAAAESPTFKVNTNTRTQFKDEFYETHMSIADKVSSPNFRNSALMQSGHKGMDCMSPTDPRQHTVKPASSPDVGPGSYDVDPMYNATTGLAYDRLHDSHHMLAFAKDPSRPSPAFRSPTRETKDPRVGGPSDTTAIPYLPPNFSSWTNAGFYSPKEQRSIKSESWGPNSREPRPPPVDTLYDPQVTQDGRAGTCSAYAQAQTSPSYHNAFHSTMPRIVPLPGGARPDTRIKARTHAQLVGTPPTAGPGSYSLEPPRYRSFHAALSRAEAYHSLASGSTPAATAPISAGHQHLGSSLRRDGQSAAAPPRSPGSGLGGTGRLSLQTPAGPLGPLSLPSSPAAHRAAAPGSPSAASAALLASQRLGSLPGPVQAAGEEAPWLDAAMDWEVHQALTRGHYHQQGEGFRLPLASVSMGRGEAVAAAAAGLVGQSGEGEGRLAVGREAREREQHGVGQGAAEAQWTEEDEAAAAADETAASYAAAAQAAARAHSAPPTPLMSPTRRPAGKFDSLVFLRRAVPYNSLMRAHLNAAADVAQARKLARSDMQPLGY